MFRSTMSTSTMSMSTISTSTMSTSTVWAGHVLFSNCVDFVLFFVSVLSLFNIVVDLCWLCPFFVFVLALFNILSLFNIVVDLCWLCPFFVFVLAFLCILLDLCWFCLFFVQALKFTSETNTASTNYISIYFIVAIVIIIIVITWERNFGSENKAFSLAMALIGVCSSTQLWKKRTER